jgi:hypothetical protein
MRHSFLYITALFAITACGNMDDFPELAAISEQEETEVTVNLTDTIRINETPLSGEVETVPSATAGEDGYKDFVENFLYDDDSGTWDDGFKTLEVTFTDDGATYVFKNKNGKVKELDTSTLNVTTDGAHITVNAYKKMNYILNGSTTNGSFKIYSDKKFIVTLNGVSITNPSGAAINCQKGEDGGKRCFLVVNDGTSNYLCDGDTYNTPEGEDEKGTIFSEGKVCISGGGYLNVKSVGKHAFVSDDYVYLHKGPQITITPAAGYDGIKTNDGVHIAGGVLNISCSGYASKGINTEGNIDISGGRTTIVSNALTANSDDDTSKPYCIKCDSTFLISDGALLLSASNEQNNGIKVKQSLTVDGGTMVIVSAGTPMSYDSLIHNSGVIYVNNEELYKTKDEDEEN